MNRLARPTIARWPLEVDEDFDRWRPLDPWVALVKDCLTDYRLGRADRASTAWHDDVVWRVIGGLPAPGEWQGADAIFDYHRMLERKTRGAFRQRLIALQASGGPVVQAHVNTVASRADRRIEVPSLIVFELSGGRVRTVTEMPGDHAGWVRFWSD